MGFIHMFRDTRIDGPIMVLVLRSTLESWGPLLFLYGFMFVAGECLAVSILACWLCPGFQPCRGTFHVTMYQISFIVFETMRATLDVPRWTYPFVHHFLSLLNFLHLPLLILGVQALDHPPRLVRPRDSAWCWTPSRWTWENRSISCGCSTFSRTCWELSWLYILRRLRGFGRDYIPGKSLIENDWNILLTPNLTLATVSVCWSSQAIMMTGLHGCGSTIVVNCYRLRS